MVEEKVDFAGEHSGVCQEDGRLSRKLAVVTVHVLETCEQFLFGMTFDPDAKLLGRNMWCKVFGRVEVEEILFGGRPVLAGEMGRAFDDESDFTVAIAKDV